MRVAFDVTVSARAVTGVGVYARHLYEALVARHVDVRAWQYPLGATGRGVRRIANGTRLAAWQGVVVGHRARREGISVVHATTSVGPLGVHCPVVLTIHDATTVTMPIRTHPADRLFHRIFSVGAARRAAAILAPTQVAADAIAEHYRVPRARIHVVALGVADRFRQVTSADVLAARCTYGLERPYVLFVGADTPRKNLQTLVRAMALVGATHTDVELVCAGPTGPHAATLDAVGRAAGLRRPIRRLGEIAERSLPGLYAGAACVAYVSLCEGFGLPVAEAMAAGAPVVTSNRSSMPEVAGGAAMLVDPTSAEAVADGLGRVLGDDALATRLRAAGRVRSTAFDWRRTAQLTEQVYLAVCDGSPQRTRRALPPAPSSAPAHSPADFTP